MEQTIFSDEKQFSLDGPDDWRSYMLETTTNDHIKRQCGVSTVMVWMMAMSNGIFSFEVIKATMHFGEYIKPLSENVVLIIKLNYANNWYLQEDNSPVHKS